MSDTTNPPPGWYPDPSGQAPFRYWDGGRWTEHTNNGTPAPVQQVQPAPFTPQPAVPAAPANPLAPQAPGYLPGAPAAAPAGASSGISAQGLLADLQKFEGFAVMVAGALLFIIASFLPWLASEGTNGFGGSAEDSVNAWDGDQPWMILGWDVSVQSLSSGDTSGTTDMLILLPIALVAVGAAAAPKLGKQFAKSREVATGAGVLLGVLTVAEVFSLSSSIDDFNSILSQNGFAIEASLSAGAWIGAIAAVVVAVGAVRLYMAEKQSP